MCTFVYPLWSKILLLWITVKEKSRKTVWGVVLKHQESESPGKLLRMLGSTAQRGWFNKWDGPWWNMHCEQVPGAADASQDTTICKTNPLFDSQTQKRWNRYLVLQPLWFWGSERINWHQWSHSQVTGLEATTYKMQPLSCLVCAQQCWSSFLLKDRNLCDNTWKNFGVGILVRFREGWTRKFHERSQSKAKMLYVCTAWRARRGEGERNPLLA